MKTEYSQWDYTFQAGEIGEENLEIYVVGEVHVNHKRGYFIQILQNGAEILVLNLDEAVRLAAILNRAVAHATPLVRHDPK